MKTVYQFVIVEDDTNIINLIKKILTLDSYQIRNIVKSGEKAVQTINQNNCDLIIMDIKLNGKMSGIEAAIKINEKYEIPVIFVTGLEDEKIFEQAKLSFTYGYLLKPFTVRELQITVELALFKHQSEKKQRQQELYLENIIDTMNDSLVVTDSDGLIRTVNKSLCYLLQYEADDLIGKHFGYFCVDIESNSCELQSLINKSDPGKQIELHFKSKDGTIIPMFGAVALLKTGNSKPGIICSATDIRQLKRIESELKLISDGFTSIVDKSSDGIMIIDDNDKIQYANHTVKVYFGNENLIGQKFEKKIDPEEVLEVDIYRLDWGIGTAQIKTTSVIWQGGPVRLSVMRDITDYKRKEEKLEMVNNDLQKANEMITTILKDLKTARDEARAATQSKSEFLAKMSHEIRTPLNMIISSIRLLQETTLHQEQRKYVDMIYYSSDALLSLIEDILDLSKIEANKLELEHIEYDLWQTVERTIDIFSINAYKKGLELIVLIHDEVPQFVKGDPF